MKYKAAASHFIHVITQVCLPIYSETEFEYDYSIGELIEFLPNYIDSGDYLGYLCIFYIGGFWQINYDQDFRHKVWQCEELIDALYEFCVKLKNEGVI